MSLVLTDPTKRNFPTLITRDNVDYILDSGKLYVAITTNGRWWQAYRNGATKHWKRGTSRINVPFKYGFRGTGAIETSDFHYRGAFLNPEHFRHSDDLNEDR